MAATQSFVRHVFSQHDTGRRLSMHWHQKQTLAIKHWTGLIRKFHCIVFLSCHFGSVPSCCILLWVTCFDQRCQRLARRGNSTWHVQWMYLMVARTAKQRKRHGQVAIFSVVRFWHFDFCFETGQGWRRGTRVVCGWLRPLRGCTWLKNVSYCHSAWLAGYDSHCAWHCNCEALPEAWPKSKSTWRLRALQGRKSLKHFVLASCLVINLHVLNLIVLMHSWAVSSRNS